MVTELKKIRNLLAMLLGVSRTLGRQTPHPNASKHHWSNYEDANDFSGTAGVLHDDESPE